MSSRYYTTQNSTANPRTALRRIYQYVSSRFLVLVTDFEWFVTRLYLAASAQGELVHRARERTEYMDIFLRQVLILI